MTAWKAKDMVAKGAISLLIGAIDNAESAGSVRVELSDAQIEALIRKQAKQVRDASVEFRAAGRVEQANVLDAEADVMEAYLPSLKSEEETRSIVRGIVDGGAANIGAVMKALGSDSTIDKGLASRIAREML